MSEHPLILITGASGFIGSHIVLQALDAGYRVRITSRSGKVDALRKLYGSRVEVFTVDDLDTSDYSESLKGVYALIHTAMPLPFGSETSNLTILNCALAGTTNILEQAVQAGVQRVIVTMSLAVMVNLSDPSYLFSDYVVTENDYNPATWEEGIDASDLLFVYAVGKSHAEKEVWKFAAKYPHIDFTTIHPPYVYGPLAPGFITSKGNIPGLSSVGVFYKAVLPLEESRRKLLPVQTDTLAVTVDVRDVARAHILSLSAAKSDPSTRKRILVAAKQSFTWKMAVDHLRSARPELRERLADTSEVVDFTMASLDNKTARHILGMQSFIDWRKTVEDTVDSILALEAEWSARS